MDDIRQRNRPIFEGRSFHKLNQNVLGTWNPDGEPVYAFTSKIVKPNSSSGMLRCSSSCGNSSGIRRHCQKWFRSVTLSSEQSSGLATVDGWIQRMERAFPVNRLENKNKAKRRKYGLENGKSISAYIFDKVELLKASNRTISERDMIDEIWLGLTHAIQ